MSRRIEIELTSERPDGTWTWRAAGAKQPKGELASSVLHEGAKVGDVLRADADFAVDGIEILATLPPKAARKQPELLEVIGTRSDEPLVTTQLVTKGGRGKGRDRGDRGDRGDRRDGRGRGRDRSHGDGDRDRGRGGRPGGDRPRGPRPDPVPERPRPKRLRPGRTHRSAVLDELAVEERPIAEQVLRGGVPAVREAIAKQNEQAKKENRPEIPSDQLVALAESLLPRLRAAEWRDKADAAVADLDELDLRDLRSVVVAADGNTRDDEAKALLVQLQEGLARRVEQEQTNWIDDMTANLDAGRFVRALRLSSRPPKAGTPLPPELATRLITAVSEGLTPTVNQDLWAAAVDALAFSPVRNQVTPAGRPEQPSEALMDAVRRVGDRLPAIVELFGLDPAEVAAAAKRRGRGGKGARGGAPRGKKKPAERGEGRTSGRQSSAEAAAAVTPAEGGDDVAPPEADPADRELDAPAEASAEVAAPVDDVAPVDDAAPVEDAAPAEDAAPDQDAGTPATEPAAEVAPPSEESGTPTDAIGEGPSEGEVVEVAVADDQGPAEVEVPAGAQAAAEVEREADQAPAADDAGSAEQGE